MTNKINIVYYKTKIGELIIGSYDEKICMLDYRHRKKRTAVDNRIKKHLKTDFLEQETAIIIETQKQIDEYLEGKRKEFDVPLLLLGSDFQQQVWNELLKVGYGATASYLDLAQRINNPKAFRAVASANGANAIALMVPCHRIIESNGGLGGYAGGVSVKKRLLRLEAENAEFAGQKKGNQLEINF